MAYITAWHTDIGIQKDTNQDSALLLQADSLKGPILLAAICDGMGGLAKGEVASASITERLKRWFKEELPILLKEEEFPTALSHSWEHLIQEENYKISAYGRQFGWNLGTTIAAILFVENTYYIINVGDSRVYLLADQLYQVTHDQTLVQKEIDEGRLTLEEAAQDARLSVLLQCVGASKMVTPDFFTGELKPGTRYLLCCDGFCHQIAPNEIYERLCPAAVPKQEQMQQGLEELVELAKSRQETDNITAILIHV